jgi:hypothetical protein
MPVSVSSSAGRNRGKSSTQRNLEKVKSFLYPFGKQNYPEFFLEHFTDKICRN